MQIEFIENGLKVFDGNTLRTIKDEDIVTIELYTSQSYAETGYSTGRYPGEDYFFARIITNSGKIIINNLLYPELLNIDRYLNLGKFKYITRIFAFLP